jgi:Ca-activated chloride channel homolog
MPSAIFGMNGLMNPEALLLLLAVPVILAAEWLARAPGVLNMSTGEAAAAINAAPHPWRRHIPALLRALGLTLLIIALARPLHGLTPRKEVAEVIDIMLCVDVSESMNHVDFGTDRLTVTKLAVHDFVKNRKYNATDRYGLDRLGLILYARVAWTQCPLTLDYAVLTRELDAAKADPRDPRTGATAIGSALGLAVSKLKESESESKVIILLTDGRNNAGELDPLTAAEFANEYGIRVYTIGAGAADESYTVRQSLLGPRAALFGTNAPDEDMLRSIAERTGAKFYRATDKESLQGAYAEISELEKTEIEIGDYYDYEDGFLPFAVLGTVAMAASVFGRRMWFETIP